MLATLSALGSPSPTPLRSSPQPPPPEQPKGWLCDAVETLKDWKEASSLLLGGAIYLRNKKAALALEQKARPLAEVQDVKMKRPLLICPGWNTEVNKFQFLTDKLLISGQNGPEAVYLKEGKAFHDPECSLPLEQIPSNSKVFVNIWDSRKTPPDQTAPQIKQNMEFIQQSLGPGKVDLVGYSMGGLAARKYLDEGGTGVGKLVTLGTPHQGTRFAQMAARVIRRDIQWALKFSGLTAADAGAMEWLAAGSPKLAALNERWPQQQAQVEEALLIASQRELTPSVRWHQFNRGDGMVEPERSQLPNVTTRVVRGPGFMHHGSLPHDSQVFRELGQFLGFESLSTSSSDPSPVGTKPEPQTPYGEI
jgi:hypothetical protein